MVLAIWSAFAIADGADFSEKWTVVGLWIAFWFGAVAGLIGAGTAIWRE